MSLRAVQNVPSASLVAGLLLCLILLPAPDVRAAETPQNPMERLVATYANSHSLLTLAGSRIALQQNALSAMLAGRLDNEQARRAHEAAAKDAKNALDAMDKMLADVDPRQDIDAAPEQWRPYFRSLDELMRSAVTDYRTKADQVSKDFTDALAGNPPDRRTLALSALDWTIISLRIETRYMEIRRGVLNRNNPLFFLTNAQISNTEAMTELNSMLLENARQPDQKALARRHLRSSVQAAQDARRQADEGKLLVARLEENPAEDVSETTRKRLSDALKEAFQAEADMADAYIAYFSTSKRHSDPKELSAALQTGLQQIYRRFAKLQQSRGEMAKEQGEILRSALQ